MNRPGALIAPAWAWPSFFEKNEDPRMKKVIIRRLFSDYNQNDMRCDDDQMQTSLLLKLLGYYLMTYRDI